MSGEGMIYYEASEFKKSVYDLVGEYSLCTGDRHVYSAK